MVDWLFAACAVCGLAWCSNHAVRKTSSGKWRVSFSDLFLTVLLGGLMMAALVKLDHINDGTNGALKGSASMRDAG